MASTLRSKGSSNKDQAKEKGENLKQLTLQTTSGQAEASTRDFELKLLAQLEKLRKENQEGHSQTKLTLDRMETSLKGLKEDITKLENRTTEAEERISANEDANRRHVRAFRYLLHRDVDLTARCEDMQNRLRRNNLRLYRVPEGSEGKDVKGFVQELLKSALQLPPEMQVNIERAHRAMAAKPKNPSATPRSLIVRFVDYSVKDAILRQAWEQRKVMYKEEQIYFDHDYSPELQKKRARVRDAIKQLKQKNIRAKCLYPAQLKVYMEDGEKTYSTMAEASSMLQGLGVQVRVAEREQMERELARDRWSTTGGRRGREPVTLTHTEIESFFNAEN